jgi:tetratricopeptide (TPR) repeat protein
MSRPLTIRILIFLATLLAFGNLFTADFSSWDDPFTVASNPHLNPPTLSGLAYQWRTPEYGLYIPVTYTGWWLLAHVAHLDHPDARGVQLNAAIFHGANVLLHAINALIVFAILRRILKRDWPAGIGALLFALHPVQVEAVGWVSGMKDVLAGTLSLGAILQYMIFATTASRRRWWHYAGGILLFIGAILSKPSAMTVPGLLVVIDWLCLARPMRKVALSVAPWIGVTLLAAASAKFLQPAIGIFSPPIWARPFIASDSLTFYLYKLVWPVNLGIDYGRRPQVVMHEQWFYLTPIIPVVLAILLWRVRRSRPLLVASALIFLVAISPMLGLTRFLFQYYSTTADHYLYVAMLGPALALGWLMTRMRKQTAYALCGVALALLGVLSAMQTTTWKDDQALFTQAISVNPKSFAGYNNLGYLYTIYAQHTDDPEKRESLLHSAAECFHNSIVANPDYPDSHYNLAITLAVHGDVEAAINEIKESLRLRAQMPKELNRGFENAYLHLAQLLVPRHRYAEAVEAYREYLKYAPSDEQAKRELDGALRLLHESATTTQL